MVLESWKKRHTFQLLIKVKMKTRFLFCWSRKIYSFFLFIFLIGIEKIFLRGIDRDGNEPRQGRKMGSSSLSHMILSYSIPTPSCMTGNTFSPHPRPLGPHEALSHSVKLYFLLIYPTTSTIFLMKLVSLIKIYLKLQLNLSHQIKSIFRKNWIIYPSI